MAELRLKGDELECAKRLGKLFEQGQLHYSGDDYASLGLNEKNAWPTLVLLKQNGLIHDLHFTNPPGVFFKINGQAVAVAREIEASEKKKPEAPDIVDQMKKFARSNRLIAPLLVVLFSLSALMVLISQTITVLEKLGVIPK